MKWFAYDPEEGVVFFETEAEARDAAEDTLQACQDISAEDGWPENTEEIVYGEVRGGVVETSRVTREEWNRTHDIEDEPFPGGSQFDEMVEYAIKEIEK